MDKSTFLGYFSEKMRRCVWLLAALCLCVQLAPAQISAIMSLYPETVETGDTFTLRVLVSGTRVAPKDVNFGSWSGVFPAKNILSKTAWRRSGQHWTQKYSLIYFDSATLNLPPLLVSPAAGEAVETNSLRITVYPTPTGNGLADMATIRQIRREPVHWTDYWPWYAAILVLVALLLLIVRKLAKKKPKPLPAPVEPQAPPPPPAHVKALAQLDQLAQEKPWKTGDTKTYYSALSLILREYLENRFTFPALESTTQEIMAHLRKAGLPDDLHLELKELLSKSDLVKYAQTQPPESFHEKALKDARTVVETLG